jgi:hypothetical protein
MLVFFPHSTHFRTEPVLTYLEVRSARNLRKSTHSTKKILRMSE